MDKHAMIEALLRLRIREVGSEHDFSLWYVECFGEGWSMKETAMPTWLPTFEEGAR